MNTRHDLMRILALSYPQLRERLEALASMDGLLEGQVRKGLKGRLEYSPAVLNMLRDVEALVRNHNMRLSDAVKEVGRKIKGDGLSSDCHPDSKGVKDQLIEALEREIRRLEGEVLFLRGQVSQLTPLALPRGRWWWPFRRAE